MTGSRFDALTRALVAGTSRRRLLRLMAGLGLGGLFVQRLTPPASARAKPCFETECQCTCGTTGCSCGFGILGAGLVQTPEGEAQLRLLATRHWSAAVQQEVVTGFVAWAHPGWQTDGLLIESVRLEAYGPIDGIEGGREVRGWAHGGEGGAEDPFTLRVVTTPAGDRAELWAGDAARGTPVAGASGFAYQLGGELSAGKLQLVSFDMPDAATPVS